jgi:K+-transporting ATPase ATPase C chain
LERANDLAPSAQRCGGSALIGQNFSDPKNFWGRPSATSPMANNAANSGASNQGPLNPALIEQNTEGNCSASSANRGSMC